MLDVSRFLQDGMGQKDLKVRQVTAAAADVLSPKKIVTAAGALITGTIPSKTSQTYTPGTANQTIAAGQYLSGIQTIAGDADLVGGNIIDTKNIFGVQGTLANKVGSNTIIVPTASAIAIPAGYYGGALTDGKVAGVAMAAGEVLAGFSDTSVNSSTSGTYVSRKSAAIKGSGVIRVRFDLACSVADGTTAYGRIYKNGVAVGIERTIVNSTTFVTFTEDFAVADGDTIALYIRDSLAGNYYASCKNFRVYLAQIFPYVIVAA